VILGVGLVGLVLAFLLIRGASPLREPPPPDPNGYADLIRAGHSVAGPVPGPRGDYQAANADELRKWVEANGDALALAQVGLKRECRVTLPVTPQELQAHLRRSSDLRQLCRLLGAAAQLAEIEGQQPEMIRIGLDVIKVAQQGTRGGLVVDVMAGFACESIGQHLIAKTRDKLTDQDCRTLVTALEMIDANREPIDLVVRRDRALFTAQYNILTRTMLALSPSVNQFVQKSLVPFELASQRTIARLRLLIAELAVGRYRLERGTEPTSLDALVPRYLAKVPVDPYSGRPIHYRAENLQGHRLYCVGPDGQDDDGNALPEKSDWSNARGDVLVEPVEAPAPPKSVDPQLKTPSARTP
jgi:hypothetical protein